MENKFFLSDRGTAITAATKNTCYKDSHNSSLIQADTQRARMAIALDMLKNGMQATAMGLNVMIGTNDARRWITEVRRQVKGYVVVTYRLRDRRVVYRLEKIAAEPTLFSELETADERSFKMDLDSRQSQRAVTGK